MRIKIRKNKQLSCANIIELQIMFVLFERFLVQVFKFPEWIIYGTDILNLWLLIQLIKTEKWKNFSGLVVLYLGMTLPSLIIGFANYGVWGGNFASTMVDIRNIIRFPIFFLACTAFLNEKHITKIYKILTAFFAINIFVILYQYFTFFPPGVWMRGDLLNGLFGKETGGNTFVNVILVVVVTYLQVCWAHKKIPTTFFVCAIGASLLVSALIELKAFFVEILFIYGYYLLKKKKGRKEIFYNIILIVAAVPIAVVGLNVMYQEYPWFKNFFSLSGFWQHLTGNGYTGKGDLNRLTGIFTIASQFFNGELGEILFGIGVGNASPFEILGSQALFYNCYGWSHYTWFSTTYLFVQGGAFTLLLYLSSFAYLYFKGFKHKRNIYLGINTNIMCIMAIFLVFYGEALRTDAGYFVYFALASGFVKSEEHSVVG